MSKFLRGSAVVAAAAGLVMSAALPAVAATSAAPAPTPTITITAASLVQARKAVDKNVFVSYHAGKLGQAALSGKVTSAAAGDDVRLYAQPFPFTSAATQINHATLAAGGTQSYRFVVTPGIETRYTVKLFSTATATAPVPGVAAAHKPIFVVSGGTINGPQRCKRPVCHETFRFRVVLPASALGRESVKHWFVYLGVHLTTKPRKIPSEPTILKLDGKATASKAKRLAPGVYRIVLKFSFRIGNDGFSWGWTACTRDTQAADGIGLPGRHSCGNKQISTKLTYLG